METKMSAQIPVERFKKARALSILVHTAYHLGGIRLTLGAIRAGA